MTPEGIARVPADTDKRAAAERVLASTGRSSIPDAMYWLATGGALATGNDVAQTLRDVLAVGGTSEDARKAVVTLTRSAARSELDSATVIFGAANVRPPVAFRKALVGLAARCKLQTLKGVSPDAVLEAQRADPFTIEALCAVAGLAYADLRSRAPGVPGDPNGEWTPSTMREAFAVIDRIVRGLERTELLGAMPARPIELMPAFGASLDGWEAIDHSLHAGVPYEVLLAQRAAGGSWLAHRNATSNLINRAVADDVCAALDRAGLEYRRSSAVGGNVQPTVVQALANSDKQTGIVVLDRSQIPRYAVTFATARDSGTARTSAARLRAMKRDGVILMALVLTGPGWAERNETAGLAYDFDGRIFSEMTIDGLTADIKATIESKEDG